MPTIIPAESVSSLSSRSLGDPFLEIAWLSTVTLEQYERLIERDDSFAHRVLRWLRGWFTENELALQSEELYLEDLSVENFMSKLDTGVILCRLVELIVCQANRLNRPVLRKCIPQFNFKIWLNAKPRSFYARDNVVNFTRWCRRFGVNESVVFESDGLVMHQTPRYVLLVLLELCRLCASRTIDPPSVEAIRKREEQRRLEIQEENRKRFEERRKLQAEAEERERRLLQQREDYLRRIIEEQERLRKKLNDTLENESTIVEECPPSPDIQTDSGIGTPTAVCFAESVLLSSIQEIGQENFIPVDRTNSIPPKSRLPVPIKVAKPKQILQPTSILDEKVNTIVNKVLKGAKLHRLSEGRYLINNRTFLVRLLNDRQVMVRVGGGWKSLEEMLKPRQSLRQSGKISRSKHSPNEVIPLCDDLSPSLTSSLSSEIPKNPVHRSKIPVVNQRRWR